ncbi:hypothetical protein [Paenibacillus sp. HJGM_3]|uniref:hypothetical protein n=1 Tax=Paenibacillus sp. HJGM_3 TaxID=3379816 RepID=UPI00385A4B56
MDQFTYKVDTIIKNLSLDAVMISSLIERGEIKTEIRNGIVYTDDLGFQIVKDFDDHELN